MRCDNIDKPGGIVGVLVGPAGQSGGGIEGGERRVDLPGEIVPREIRAAAPPIFGIGEVTFAAVEEGMPGGAVVRGDILAHYVGFIKVIGEEPEGGVKAVSGVAWTEGTLQ